MIWLSVTCHIVHHALHHTSSLIVLHHTSSLDGYYSIYSYCTLSILYKSASPQKWLRLLFQNKLDQGTEQRTKENKVRIIQFTPISQTYASPLLHQPKKKNPFRPHTLFLTIQHWNTLPSRAFIVWALNYCSCQLCIKISSQNLPKDKTLFYMILFYDQKHSCSVTVLWDNSLSKAAAELSHAFDIVTNMLLKAGNNNRYC